MSYTINVNDYASFMALLSENIKKNLTTEIKQEYSKIKTTDLIRNLFIARPAVVNKNEYQEIAVRSFTIENFKIPDEVKGFLNKQLTLTHHQYLEKN